MPRFETREQYEEWKWGRMQAVGMVPASPRAQLSPEAGFATRSQPDADTDTTWAALCHLSALLGLLLPLGHLLGPWLVMSVRKDGSRFVREHGRSALSFQIACTKAVIVAWLLSILLMFISQALALLAVLVAVVIPVYSVVMSLIAAAAAGSGNHFRYPVFWSQNR